MNNAKNHLYNETKETLKNIMPNFFSEGEFNPTAFQNFFAESHILERYRLEWFEKSKSKNQIYKSTTDTLNPRLDKSFNSENTSNIFIEADNLQAMKILRDSYANSVKVIYIDPPYNTESDFIYPDNFSDTLKNYYKIIGRLNDAGDKVTTESDTSGRKHTNWLNMMYPRLFLSWDFLAKDGVIVVHIDENEKTNLSFMLNEIFGEKNLLGELIWDKRNPKGDSKSIAYQHETLLVYAKNKQHFLEKNDLKRPKANAKKILNRAKILYSKIGKQGYPEDIMKVQKKYKFPLSVFEESRVEYDLEEINREFSQWIKKQPELSGGEKAYSNIDEKGKVYRPVSMAWPNKKDAPQEYFFPLIHPITKKECSVPARGWRNPPETMKGLLKEELIIFGEDETTIPNRKYYLEKNMFENIPSIIPFAGSDDKFFEKIKLSFENPKPHKFAKEVISYFSTGEDDIIMDFFAGSGTTGHAVMELNSEDNKNRKFLLIQLPEEIKETHQMYKKGFRNLCELAEKRLEESIKLMDSTQGQDNKLGFKVFELSSTNFPAWDENTSEGDIMQQLELLNSSIDNELSAVYEVLLLLKEYTLDAEIKEVKPHLFSLGDKEKTLVFLGDKLENDYYLYIFEKNSEYKRVLIYDNALTVSQKINLIEQFPNKVETI